MKKRNVLNIAALLITLVVTGSLPMYGGLPELSSIDVVDTCIKPLPTCEPDSLGQRLQTENMVCYCGIIYVDEQAKISTIRWECITKEEYNTYYTEEAKRD